MKNVLKNILFSICFTYLDENRGNPPFIYSCARKKLWAETGVVKMKKKRKQGAFLGGKEEKGEGRGGTDGGGMKGNGDNVWENTRKEERNEVARLYTGRHLISF